MYIQFCVKSFSSMTSIILIQTNGIFLVQIQRVLVSSKKNYLDITEVDHKILEPFLNEMSCSMNDKRNLRPISGTLALTAIQENVFNQSFTTATLVTKDTIKINLKESSLSVQFRAAFSLSSILKCQVLLVPHKFNYSSKAMTNYILILEIQMNHIRFGYFLSEGINFTKEILTDGIEFRDFHNFELELKQDQFIFRINGEKKLTMDKLISHKFDQSQYRLALNLQVFNPMKDKPDEFVLNFSRLWKYKEICSSLILDHVRIFYSKNKTLAQIHR